MARAGEQQHEESQPLTTAGEPSNSFDDDRRASRSSTSTTSFILEHASDNAAIRAKEALYTDSPTQQELEMEDQAAWQRTSKSADRKARRVLYILVAIGVVGWVAAFFLFLGQDRRVPHSARPHDPHATSTTGNGKKVTFDQVLQGEWFANHHAIKWIAGPGGEDGLLRAGSMI